MGAPVELKKNSGYSEPTMQQSTANLRFLVQNKNTETDAAQHNMDEEINLFLEEQKNIFKTTLRVNSSQLQNTEEDTRAHNSSTLKINRICKGKDKEVIAESSKKVPSKEDWSMEKDLIYKKNGSSLVDQIKTGKHLEFKLACHNINGLKRNIQKFDISLDWMNENSCDVLGLVETNISDKEGFFLGRNYREVLTIWSSASVEKKKGSGVALIVRQNW